MDFLRLAGCLPVREREDGETEFLLGIRRRDNAEGGKWSTYCGHIEFGEDPKKAAAREAREESGCPVEIGRRLGIHVERRVRMGVKYCGIKHVYAATLTGEPGPGDEFERVEWLTPAEIMALPDHRVTFGTKGAVVSYLRSGNYQQNL